MFPSADSVTVPVSGVTDPRPLWLVDHEGNRVPLAFELDPSDTPWPAPLEVNGVVPSVGGPVTLVDSGPRFV